MLAFLCRLSVQVVGRWGKKSWSCIYSKVCLCVLRQKEQAGTSQRDTEVNNMEFSSEFY